MGDEGDATPSVSGSPQWPARRARRTVTERRPSRWGCPYCGGLGVRGWEPAGDALGSRRWRLPQSALCGGGVVAGFHTVGHMCRDAVLRVVARRGLFPDPAVWLLRCNPATDELKGYLSNAPADPLSDRLVWLAGLCWPIEQ